MPVKHRTSLTALLGIGLAWATPCAAFRTSADDPAFEGAVARWAGPVEFHIVDSVPAGTSYARLRDAVVQGWRGWENPACSGMELINSGIDFSSAVAGDGKNSIEWISDWSRRGFEKTAAGLTDVQYERTESGDWEIVEADIYLNNEHFTWDAANSGGDRRIDAVIAHEMGHALGLLHVCEPKGASGAPPCDDDGIDSTALMHPVYDEGRVAPATDDVAGICSLYPSAQCGDSGCAKGEVCTTTGCEPTCEPECAEGIACLDGKCVEPKPAECPNDADCTEPGQARARGQIGDTCNRGAECRGGVCNEHGCTQLCGHDLPRCPSNSECQDDVCVPLQAGLGAACSVPEECLGARCLQVDQQPSVCTRGCEQDGACPLQWSCQVASGKSVCAPRGELTLSNGCSLAKPAHSSPVRLLKSYSFLALALGLLWRRKGLRRPSALSLSNNEQNNARS